MVAASPTLNPPQNFNKAAHSHKSLVEKDDVAKISLAGIAFMLATEFVSNAFLHFSPTGLGLSAAFANAMGWVPSAAAIGATSAATVGGQAALTF